MNKKFLTLLAGASLGIMLPSPIVAATLGGSSLFQPTVDLSSGIQNGYVGYIGGVFLTTYSDTPSVNYLGYFDRNGDGLVNSHAVSLWDGANSLVASVIVPAGTSAPLVDGYRWVQLPSTVNLAAGSWYVINAQADGVDTWGDFITDDAGAGQINWSGEYVVAPTDYAGWGWSRAGRYDSSAPAANQSGTDAIYPAANLGFDIVAVPEPGTLAILALGGVLFGFARKQH